MNRSLKVRLEALKTLSPITENQKKVFEAYKEGSNICLAGSAGTGKTFLSMYLGLEDVLDKETQYEKLVIIRSIVSLRAIRPTFEMLRAKHPLFVRLPISS